MRDQPDFFIFTDDDRIDTISQPGLSPNYGRFVAVIRRQQIGVEHAGIDVDPADCGDIAAVALIQEERASLDPVLVVAAADLIVGDIEGIHRALDRVFQPITPPIGEFLGMFGGIGRRFFRP